MGPEDFGVASILFAVVAVFGLIRHRRFRAERLKIEQGRARTWI